SVCGLVDRRGLHSFPTRRASDLRASSSIRAAKENTRRRCLGYRPLDSKNAPSSRSLRVLVRSASANTRRAGGVPPVGAGREPSRSEEHTSELQSRENLVCRPLLE